MRNDERKEEDAAQLMATCS